MYRIWLSPPEVDDVERKLLLDAFDSNWIAPLGPHVDQFESEMACRLGVPATAALSSGTAALHLALLISGVQSGDDVLVQDLTFIATANAVSYVGARPVFVDSEPSSWCLDPDLVESELERRAADGTLPAAVVSVDVYGQCADYGRLIPICDRFDVPLIADSAEALGASRDGVAAGAHTPLSVLSFNGNKIITTSGGGMLVARDAADCDRARHLATQARLPAPHYEHDETGFNYRMSNLLAAVGRGQLSKLGAKVEARQTINEQYRDRLGVVPGIGFMPIPCGSEPNHWLTVITIDPDEFGADRDRVREALIGREIESRPGWKPMHLQPVFADAPVVGGAVTEQLFDEMLCLPSGSALTESEVDEICGLIVDSRS